jgi:hypothetical protein
MKYVDIRIDTTVPRKAGGFVESVVKLAFANDVKFVGRHMMFGSIEVSFSASAVMML